MKSIKDFLTGTDWPFGEIGDENYRVEPSDKQEVDARQQRINQNSREYARINYVAAGLLVTASFAFVANKTCEHFCDDMTANTSGAIAGQVQKGERLTNDR